jgi:hypothetical protein
LSHNPNLDKKYHEADKGTFFFFQWIPSQEDGENEHEAEKSDSGWKHKHFNTQGDKE